MLAHDAIRQMMCRRRQQIPYGAQIRAAHRLATNITQTPIYQHSQQIAFYWAVAGEISLKPLLAQAWKDDKTCYLPVIEGDQLLFVNVTPTTPMKNNRYGIPEPISGGLIQAQHLELVLTPLVAFDRHCHRIGMGGGFYDRTFGAIRQAEKQNGLNGAIYMMGVAHQSQQTTVITPASWDVVLDCVVTDKR